MNAQQIKEYMRLDKEWLVSELSERLDMSSRAISTLLLNDIRAGHVVRATVANMPTFKVVDIAKPSRAKVMQPMTSANSKRAFAFARSHPGETFKTTDINTAFPISRTAGYDVAQRGLVIGLFEVAPKLHGKGVIYRLTSKAADLIAEFDAPSSGQAAEGV